MLARVFPSTCPGSCRRPPSTHQSHQTQCHTKFPGGRDSCRYFYTITRTPARAATSPFRSERATSVSSSFYFPFSIFSFLLSARLTTHDSLSSCTLNTCSKKKTSSEEQTPPSRNPRRPSSSFRPTRRSAKFGSPHFPPVSSSAGTNHATPSSTKKPAKIST